MKYELKDKTLTLYFQGELNSYNAEEVEKEIEKVIKGNPFSSLKLHFGELKYISSAGLRIILKLKQRYDDTTIIEVPLNVYDILEMTGFTSMITVQKALRNISVEGAEIIGTGFFSTVYRINKDTIIKVFNRVSDPQQIERELKLAKQAFVLGIPTAISFDIVKVGDKLGVCFEMLDCSSLKNAVLEHPEKAEEYLQKYADLIKKVTTTECYDVNIPSMKEFFQRKVELIKPYLGDKYYQKAKNIVDNIEERHTLLHGDCHFKNIMVQGDELLLIDMDTLSVGHPIFELALIYCPYVAFEEDAPGNTLKFFGIKNEDAKNLYNAIVVKYFGKDDPIIKDKIKLLAYIHMVWWNRVNEPDNEVRLNGCKARLINLLDKYDDVNVGI